ncbi:MAG: hypothetical protein ACRDSL_27570 [Pseudonocardiaceae bacterium]
MLLHLIDSAAAPAPHGAERYPDNSLQAATYSAAAGEPVGTGYRRLLAQVST